MLGPKGPTVAAEGCSPPQELEKAARRVANFPVILKAVLKIEEGNQYYNFLVKQTVFVLFGLSGVWQ